MDTQSHRHQLQWERWLTCQKCDLPQFPIQNHHNLWNSKCSQRINFWRLGLSLPKIVQQSRFVVPLHPPQLSSKLWYSHFSDLHRSIIIKLSRLCFGHSCFLLPCSELDSSTLPAASAPSVRHLLHPYSPLLRMPSSQFTYIRQLLYLSLVTHHLFPPFTTLDIIGNHNIHVFHLTCSFISQLSTPRYHNLGLFIALSTANGW